MQELKEKGGLNNKEIDEEGGEKGEQEAEEEVGS